MTSGVPRLREAADDDSRSRRGIAHEPDATVARDYWHTEEHIRQVYSGSVRRRR
ncbi:MAG: hypothetical protein ACRDSE_13770 [Pseudonocardiaceae bacterium]